MDNKAQLQVQASVNQQIARALIEEFRGDLPMNFESVKRKLSKMGIKNPQQQESVNHAAMLLLNLQ